MTGTFGVGEKVIQDHFIKLKALRLIYSQAEHIFKESWHSGFAFLVSYNDDAIAAELVLTILIFTGLIAIVAATPDQIVVKQKFE